MQTNTSSGSISWKKINEDVSIGHFSSVASLRAQSTAQVYVKKFESKVPEEKNKITIFMLHDIGQHLGRYQALIDWFKHNKSNINFVAMDFIGHGLSSGTRGHFEKFDHLAQDINFLLSHTEKKDENEKWIILGHGMGGLVALDLLRRFPESMEKKIDGLILSNIVLDFFPLLTKLENNFFSLNLSFDKLIEHLRPFRVQKGINSLSMADDILNFEQDPLIIHRPTLNSLREILKKMTNLQQDSYFLGKPLMLLKSNNDNKKSRVGIERFAKGIKKDLLTQKNYFLMKHDLYNDREKENVFNDIIDWMKKYEN